MKRGIPAALLLGASSLLGACSDTTSTAGAAGLSGTYDVVLANQLVFVTSQDRDELRVLDLERSPREFLPAPNPLEPLSIPVIARPDSLTRDVGYDTEGYETTGPYIYARSSGGRSISVVASDRARLNEVTRLSTGQLITAFTAHAPVSAGAPSVLFYALQTRPEAAEQLCGPFGGGVVMRQDLPGPENFDAAALPPALPVFCLRPADTVLSMVTLPVHVGVTESLVLAIRNVTGTSRLVRAVADGGSVEIPYKRPRPVPFSVPDYTDLVDIPARFVTTHPTFFTESGLENDRVQAGRYVYAVLDELTCASADCEGVIALDNGTDWKAPSMEPVLARDASNAPMLTLRPSSGLPTGLTLRPDLQVRQLLADGSVLTPRVPLLGIMPSSSGEITLFRADERRAFNLDRIPVSADPVLKTEEQRAAVAVELRDGNETALADTFQGISVNERGSNQKLCPQNADVTNAAVFLCDGTLPNGTYRFVFQGVLPGLLDLSRDVSVEDPPFLVETSLATSRGVMPGDSLVLANTVGACEQSIKVLRLEDQGDGRTRLFPDLADTDTALALANCATYPSFSVRAGPTAKPYVLYAGLESSDSYLQRLAVGEAYTVSTLLDYYYHPDKFDLGVLPPTAATFAPAPLTLTLTATFGDAERLNPGDRYVVTLQPRFRRFIFKVDADSASSNLAAYRLPGTVVATNVGTGDAASSLAYIAYPSADGLLQIALEQISDNAENLQFVRAFQ
ncbi:hypothetical protein [Corallococcus llansteffanensis]|uniref:Lipoprotein n=1 Tax=Corallococcus llansteffanensis TaxID=2316731 RepID=A0A3A8NSC9_9BACT|nr:hypothetical protein [Corallococcus llansteffanensis]RKH42344.1 hypothetical protein D7V93_37940 [Corallococcus llansteffanensis]